MSNSQGGRESCRGETADVTAAENRGETTMKRKTPVFSCARCGAQNLTRREKVAHVCPQLDLFGERPQPSKKPKPGLTVWLGWLPWF